MGSALAAKLEPPSKYLVGQKSLAQKPQEITGAILADILSDEVKQWGFLKTQSITTPKFLQET